jgi:hypothetical protein
MDFGVAGSASRVVKVIREGVKVARAVLERRENNVFRWHGYVLQLV